MSKLNLIIRNGKPNADGSFNIKIAISAKGQTSYLATKYNVNSAKEWRNGRVVKRADADLINRKLSILLMECEDTIDETPDAEFMTASELRSLLANRNKPTDLIVDYCRSFIEKLKANGQDSYAQNMGYTLKYLTECFGERVTFREITSGTLEKWERFMFECGNSSTTVNIRMTHLKALLNAAINDEIVEYRVFPFRKYRIPQKAVRDLCISKDELKTLEKAVFKGVAAKRMNTARDLFFLSFYCAGINLTDLMEANLTGDELSFVRKKTANKKQGEKLVRITIQPEARAIMDRYMDENGRLDFGYNYRDYEQFRSFVTKSLNRIGEELGFEKRLMFYSARKTFCQFGYELGIPLFVLEYAIGQTIKDASNRPIFNYIKIMQNQADAAIRAIIDYSKADEPEQ